MNSWGIGHSCERITVQQALRMATCKGAYATFDEKERGSLEVDPDMLKDIHE